MWLYSINGKNVGPVSFEEIVNQIQAGTISQQTIVCEIGQKPCRAGQNPKLRSLFINWSVNQTLQQGFNTNPSYATSMPQNMNSTQNTSVNRRTPLPDTNEHELLKSKGFLGLIIAGGAVALIGVLLLGFLFLRSGTKRTVASQSKQENPVITENLDGEKVEVNNPTIEGSDDKDMEVKNPEPEIPEDGSAEDYYNLAIKYRDGDGVEKNSPLAFKLFEKAAQLGHAQAQRILGDLFLSLYDEKHDQDYAIAGFHWFSQSAEQGDMDSQYMLGFLYGTGIGVEQNPISSIEWYKRSANQGNIAAQNFLGAAYYFGHSGVFKDEAEAVKWYRKAANQGDAHAQSMLASCCYLSDGKAIDRKEGLKWLEKAAAQGDEDAIKWLNDKSMKRFFDESTHVNNEDDSIHVAKETETKKNDDEFISQHANADGSFITISPKKRSNTITNDPNRFVQEINGVPFVYRWCPAGEFTMGSPEDEEDRAGIEKQHKVKLTKGFWILETEVTYEQWCAVIDKSLTDTDSRYGYPVENISWDTCIIFCKACKEKGMEVKLPTEAQWEYACRAGTDGPFAGDFESLTCYLGNSSGKACRVKEYSANAWKIYGMHGNVAEWCADWGGGYKLGDQTDPIGPDKGTKRVTRGGSWGSTRSYCRSAYRGSLEPNKKTPGLGFRLILLGHDKEE